MLNCGRLDQHQQVPPDAKLLRCFADCDTAAPWEGCFQRAGDATAVTWETADLQAGETTAATWRPGGIGHGQSGGRAMRIGSSAAIPKLQILPLTLDHKRGKATWALELYSPLEILEHTVDRRRPTAPHCSGLSPALPFLSLP